jgi:membrane-associated HD superfamily phosphohydrolase
MFVWYTLFPVTVWWFLHHPIQYIKNCLDCCQIIILSIYLPYLKTYNSRYQTFIYMYILYTSLIWRMSSCTLIFNKVFVLSYFVFTKTTPLWISSREGKAYLCFSSLQTRTIFMHVFSIFPCILIFSEKKRQNFR